jgi:hypothetical protein
LREECLHAIHRMTFRPDATAACFVVPMARSSAKGTVARPLEFLEVEGFSRWSQARKTYFGAWACKSKRLRFMKCSKCGAPCMDNDEACMSCGQSLRGFRVNVKLLTILLVLGLFIGQALGPYLGPNLFPEIRDRGAGGKYAWHVIGGIAGSFVGMALAVILSLLRGRK